MANIAIACSCMPDAPPATLIKWAREVEDSGLYGVFMTEAGNDSLACSLALGLSTNRIMLGTAITNIYLRHPALLLLVETEQDDDPKCEDKCEKNALFFFHLHVFSSFREVRL